MNDYFIIGADYDDDYLAHYGVVGMHWHHRKAVAAAAKGDMKKAQKHLDKNIANNKKKNGFYYKSLEKVTKKEINKYNDPKEKRRRKTLIGLAAIAAAGYGSAAALDVRYRKMDKAFSSHRYGANESMGVARENKYGAGKLRKNSGNKRSSALRYNLQGGKSPNSGARNKRR